MTIQIIIDGGADVPSSFIEKQGIKVVPLNLHFGEEQYKTGVDLDLQSFYRKLKAADELPRSSSPSPNDFYEMYKSVDPDTPILNLALTQGLSSTYEHAEMGKQMLLEEEPDRRIAVINTKTASCGVALLADDAVKRIEEGMAFEDIVSHMEERLEKATTLFVLKTLENVIKGGRLDRVKGTIAKTLNIKLLMKATEEVGDIDVTEKVRGNKKAIRRLVEQIGEYTSDFEDKVIAISHCNDEKNAQALLEKIKGTYPFKDSILTEMGPLISTYSGEGGLVVAFYKD
ncbi:DegV family protein [Salimicrobium halophilum]|uniref:EDD domain protein, DegV family n=1 Tax=Salimicrobium halophilum TaxID=86666 RepID=A0A1G8VRW7_9BACI|nr:DegV family protein [Salimicrobium halophilum]SDJ68135.1 EDD domain protein, DegV family [Salimicrobium halophilum]